ncbi:deoxyxylulose-5-phosphate synthase [Streptomyces sp. SID161]|uniref:deoxyxylulose-5-phosphate synthase n=1 Tax=Streptomyces sp. SID161 TaxID=2690251 RepID=UPI001F251C53|nr:deoxyxylulose-5-phosphate synthase [Streptomyces sp. SID161]
MAHGKTSYVCLPCRASYKQPYPGYHDHDRVCPRCAEPLIHVGSAFAPPKRRDTAAWRTLSVLLHAGVRFHKSCCGGPGYRPRTLSEVRERMAYARATGEPFAQALVRRDLPQQPGSRKVLPGRTRPARFVPRSSTHPDSRQ